MSRSHPQITHSHSVFKASLGDGLRIAALAADLGWRPAMRGRQPGEVRLTLDDNDLTITWGPAGAVIRAAGVAALALVESAAEAPSYCRSEVQP